MANQNLVEFVVAAVGFFFTADMFIKFHVTTPCKSQRGNQQPEVPDGNAVAKNYMLYGGFVVDLVATVPSYIEVKYLKLPMRSLKIDLWCIIPNEWLGGWQAWT